MTTMRNEPHWLVGIEPSARSSGAVHFARWLRRSLHVRVAGVYVTELWMLMLSEPGAAQFLATARASAESWLATMKAGSDDAAFDTVESAEAMDPEGELCARGQGALGIVVGRHPTRERGWIRLGRVTRRLLRNLPAPVVVAPPELTADDFAGPVIVATDLRPASVGAARFAVAFARQAQRPLVCVHVAQPRWSEDAELAPELLSLREAYRARSGRDARNWAADYCPDAQVVIGYGDPAEVLSAMARQRGASLLVLGSGRPGLIERIFVGSTASAVASAASCAVAIVPLDAPST
jgi:nucleotide-binding universal stress UspA family protein